MSGRLEERKIFVRRCDRCGAAHGLKYVRRVPGLLFALWFFICHERQEPVYIQERYVS